MQRINNNTSTSTKKIGAMSGDKSSAKKIGSQKKAGKKGY